MVAPEPALAPVMPPVIVPIVHANVLGALAVRAILGPAPLQAEAVARFVTAGVGLTVTVIVWVDPTQLPVTEVGVIIYCTVPAVLLLGLVSAWLIVPPELADAPVIPPVIVPIVQVNVLGVLAVSVMFGPVPLHVEAVVPLVTAGLGLTVTVMVQGEPTQLPVTDVGVTIYCTEPAVVLLGLVSVWLIVLPELALAPVMLPVIVPRVQANVLATEAVREIFGDVPLHVDAVATLVTTGVGLTVTV
jgi:hypothetical protein